MKRKKADAKGGSKYQKPRKEKNTCSYDDLVRENKNFETYYKAQKLVPEEEWSSFMSTLKEDLPSAFRITGTKSQAKALLHVLKTQFFEPLSVQQDPVVDWQKTNPELKPLNPVCIPWYPGGFAWQLNLTRRDIRKYEHYWRLHQFLISETDTGNISRQEYVSMIPPLLLDIQPQHKVLDMCAAPGSKTAQLIEFLHSSDDEMMAALPPGLIVANDSDNKRCYMLTHQVKRLQSPALMITNHDAAFLPNVLHTREDGTVVPVKFDRILCDVPCSGDGTIRKNYDVWSKWNTVNAPNLHGLQLRIARRGLELLAVGGLMVYSTCSLNPIEDEAVINRLLIEAGGSVELVDASSKLPSLKFSPGVDHWTLMNRETEVLESAESIPQKDTCVFHRHMFPPTCQEFQMRKLDRCIRILPHYQNTGGFFVALLKKVAPLPGEKIYEGGQACASILCTQNVKKPQPKKRRRGFREEPFYYLEKDDPLWLSVSEYFGMKSFVDPTHFLTRSLDGKKRNVYVTNATVRDIVTLNQNKLKIINTGVKVLVRCDNKGADCEFRLAQEGLHVLLPLFTGRKLSITQKDLTIMLLHDDSELPPPISSMDHSTQEQCRHLDCGSITFIYKGTVGGTEDSQREFSPALSIELVGWKGQNSLRAYVQKKERLHYLRLLGIDTSSLETNKFQERGQSTSESIQVQDDTVGELQPSGQETENDASLAESEMADEVLCQVSNDGAPQMVSLEKAQSLMPPVDPEREMPNICS